MRPIGDPSRRREGVAEMSPPIVVRRRRRRDLSRARSCPSGRSGSRGVRTIRWSPRSSTVDPACSSTAMSVAQSSGSLRGRLISSCRARPRWRLPRCFARVQQRLAHRGADARDVRPRKVVRLAPAGDVLPPERHGQRRAPVDGGREPDEAREAVERDVGAHVPLDRVARATRSSAARCSGSTWSASALRKQRCRAMRV